jgi:hypothetical protein
MHLSVVQRLWPGTGGAYRKAILLWPHSFRRRLLSQGVTIFLCVHLDVNRGLGGLKNSYPAHAAI